VDKRGIGSGGGGGGHFIPDFWGEKMERRGIGESRGGCTGILILIGISSSTNP
jgi:hypothetical protein